MHPRVRGLGQPPRDQRPDRVRPGERPLLQGHLKPSKHGARAPRPVRAPEPAPADERATPADEPATPDDPAASGA